MGFIDKALSIGGSLLGGLIGSDSSKDAAEASSEGALAGVAENRRQFDTTLNLQAPAINTGNAARSLLASILGLDVPGSSYTVGGTTTPAQAGSSGGFRMFRGVPLPRRNTQPVPGQTTGGVTFTNPASSPMSAEDIQSRLESFPGYKFAVDQALSSAKALGSASGSLGGNVLSALGERVGGGIAGPTFENYLNRLSGLSGTAQTGTNNLSNAAINTGNSIAQGLSSAGDARASGIIGSAGSTIGTIGGILNGLGTAAGGTPPYIPNNPGSSNGIPYYLARP